MSMLTPPAWAANTGSRGTSTPVCAAADGAAGWSSWSSPAVPRSAWPSWGTLQLIDVFTGGGGTASAAGSKASCAVKSAKASPSASASPAALPKPAQITVNVLNATTRSGLAKSTADELEKRGFKIGEVGNAPKEFDKKVDGAALLLGPASALNTSLSVLSTQVGGAERRAEAGRKGAEVDLIIGNAFKALSSEGRRRRR